MYIRPLFFTKNHTQLACYHAYSKKAGELFLVRHAKSEHNEKNCCAGYDNSSNPTQDGLTKARESAKKLSEAGIKFHKFYISPLNRAKITADSFKEVLSLEFEITPALVERNFGGFTGMPKSMIKEILGKAEFNKYIHDKNFFPPNIVQNHKHFQSKDLYGTWPNNHKGESYQCVINRLKTFLEKIKEELISGQNILIVGHSHNLQILQMLLHDSPFEDGIERYKMEHVIPLRFRFSVGRDNKLIIEEPLNLFKTTPNEENKSNTQGIR